MNYEGWAVSSSTKETSGKCFSPEQLYPGFPNVCSESGVLQPVQRRVLLLTNSEKEDEKGEKLNDVDRFAHSLFTHSLTHSRVIETKIQFIACGIT